MNVVSVVLLVPNKIKGDLSYYTNKNVSVGQVVFVTVRKKEVPAVVLSIVRLKEAKMILKEARYSLRKIKKVWWERKLSEGFILATQKTADFYRVSISSILNDFVPSVYFEDIEIPKYSYLKTDSSFRPDVAVLQRPLLDRVYFYSTEMRRIFSQNKSMVMIVPTRVLAERMYASLEQTYPSKVFMLHGQLSVGRQKKILQEYLNTPGRVMLICTPLFLSVIRNDTGLIVMEFEGDDAYVNNFKGSLIDKRYFVESLAKRSFMNLLMADTLLSLRSIYRVNMNKLSLSEPLSFRFSPEHKMKVLFFEKEDSGDKYKKKSVFHKEIVRYLESGDFLTKRTLFYVPRKGDVPVTVCRDCGQVVLCPVCGRALTLYRDRGMRINEFWCHACNDRYDPMHTCVKCKGHWFTYLGMSTGSIREEIERIRPDVKTIIIDSDYTNSPAKVRKALLSFNENPGSVIVCTDMAIPYLDRRHGVTIVPSLMSLLSIPRYDIAEIIVRRLVALSAATSEEFFIQTRVPIGNVTSIFEKKSLKQFVDDELLMRKSLAYPPGVVLLNMTIAHPEATADKVGSHLKKVFPDYEISTSVLLGETKKVKASVSIPYGDWEKSLRDEYYENLQNKIRSLSRFYDIEVEN